MRGSARVRLSRRSSPKSLPPMRNCRLLWRGLFGSKRLLSSPSVRRTGKGIQDRAQRYGFPSRPLRSGRECTRIKTASILEPNSRYSLARIKGLKGPPSSPARISSTQAHLVKKVFVKSYGCQMNVYDAERMADMLATEGYSETKAMEEADLVILNTCHIREKAAEKVYSELGRVRELKQEREAAGQETKVVVAGCVAQAEGKEILRRAPAVDVVVGPQNYHNLPALLKRSRAERVVDTEFPVEDKFDHLPAPTRARTQGRGVSAFLTIQEGCDKFCTFCVVPYTRGAEVSRPVAKILDEALRLAAANVREITVIGQ